VSHLIGFGSIPEQGSYLLGVSTVNSHTKGIGVDHFALLLPVRGAQKVVSARAERKHSQVVWVSIAATDWEGIKQQQRQVLTTTLNELAKFSLSLKASSVIPRIQIFSTPQPEPECGVGYFYSWCTDLYSTKRHFAVQKWGHLFWHPPRVVMFEPQQQQEEQQEEQQQEGVQGKKRTVFPLALCSTESAAYQFLDYLSTLEHDQKFCPFTFQHMWLNGPEGEKHT